MQPHKLPKQADSLPRTATDDSVQSLIDASDLGPGAPTGSTVDRNDSSTASSKPLLEQQKSGIDSQESLDSSTTSSQPPSSTISELKPVTTEAYGGGMYGKDDEPIKQQDDTDELGDSVADSAQKKDASIPYIQ